MPLTGWLGGWRFHLIQAGRTKFESEGLTVEKTMAEGIGECFVDVVSLFLRKLRRWHLRIRHGAPPRSALNDRHYTVFLDDAKGNARTRTRGQLILNGTECGPDS